MFTKKVQQTEQAVDELEAFVREQETSTTDAAQAKQREETELEEAAYLVGSTLSIWFLDQQDEENAAKVNLTPSVWRRLRDQQLLEKARLLRDVAQTVIDGPQGAEAAEYGITTEEVARLTKEIDDYDARIAAPQQRIAERKARTSQLRDRFNAVEDRFELLDKFILHFRRTDAGRNLASAYQASRVIRDLGHRSKSKPVTAEDTVGVGA